jgi:hypothetical protein
MKIREKYRKSVRSCRKEFQEVNVNLQLYEKNCKLFRVIRRLIYILNVEQNDAGYYARCSTFKVQAGRTMTLEMFQKSFEKNFIEMKS